MKFDMMKKYPLLAMVLMLALALFATGYGGKEGPQPLPTAPVVKDDLRVEVDVVGELEAARSIVLSSEVKSDKGKIMEIVEDGKRVKAGDVLVRLDPTPFEEEVNLLTAKVLESESLVKANRELMKWETNQAEREVERCGFQVELAKLDQKTLEQGEGPREVARLENELNKALQEKTRLARYIEELKELEKRGYSSRTEIKLAGEKLAEQEENVAAARRDLSNYRDQVLPGLVQKARLQVKSAAIALDRAQKGGGHKVGQAAAALTRAEGELAAAREALVRAKAQLSRTVIKAPMPGLVVLTEQILDGRRAKPRVGDKVWQNQPLVYLPDVSRMLVRTKVREVDLHKVEPGQPVAVAVDAYPQAGFTGRVESIGVLAQAPRGEENGGKYFSLTISLDQEDVKLRPGMTARADIHCDRVAGAVSVPTHAVFLENGRASCFEETSKGFQRRDVVVGRQSDSRVEVVSGLEPGARVALVRPPQAQMASAPSDEASGKP